VFWVISVYFNIRNTLPKSGSFLLGHPLYIKQSVGILVKATYCKIVVLPYRMFALKGSAFEPLCFCLLWVGGRRRACADGPLNSNLVEWTATISQHV